MNLTRFKIRLRHLKGKAKERWGKFTGNDQLVVDGQCEQIKTGFLLGLRDKKLKPPVALAPRIEI